MTLESWALFTAMETLLCLTPGPAVLLVLSHGLRGGLPAALCASGGIVLGNTFYFVLSATSLGAVLLASAGLFTAVRWAGVAYLVWLGVAVFFGRAPALRVAPGAPPARRSRMLMNGFVLQTSNPKALVFFTALLPQFIDPAGSVAWQVAVLGVTSQVVETAVLTAYGAAAARASTLVTEPRFARWSSRAAGGMLVAAGLGLARVHTGAAR